MNNKNEVVQLLYEDLFKYKFFKKKEFFNGEIITNYIQNRNRIYFLLNGSLDLVKNNSYVLNTYRKNDLFGEEFVNINSNTELSLIAKKDGELVYFTYNDILNSNLSNDKKIKLINSIYKLLTYEIKSKNERIDLLCEGTTRNKLLSYFKLCKKKKNSSSFNLDMSFTELSEYLGVDRSAMTREIKNLIDDGIIKKEDKRITLIS